MTVIVTVIGRTDDRLEINGQDKGLLNEQGRMVDVDEGENTFTAYKGDTLVSETTRTVVDVGQPISVDLRPGPQA